MGVNINELDPILKAKLAKILTQESLGDAVFIIRAEAQREGSGISPELADALTNGLTTSSETDRGEGIELPPLVAGLIVNEGHILQEAIVAANFHENLPQ